MNGDGCVANIEDLSIEENELIFGTDMMVMANPSIGRVAHVGGGVIDGRMHSCGAFNGSRGSVGFIDFNCA